MHTLHTHITYNTLTHAHYTSLVYRKCTGIILLFGYFVELAASNNRYSEKMMNVKHSEQELINLAWKVKELSELNEMGRKLYANITQLIAKINHNDAVWEVENVPCQLSIIRKDLVIFIKGVTRHQRTAATHVLVFMISSEERRKKPYALPVQCLPYKGLADSTVRQLANKIIQEMSKRQMKVAGEVLYMYVILDLQHCFTCAFLHLYLGFVTDGEWNSLRTKGNTRPLSVLQIRADVRAKYSRMGFKTMSGMIMPLCMYMYCSCFEMHSKLQYLSCML